MEEFKIIQLLSAFTCVLIPLGVLMESHTRWTYWWERPVLWAVLLLGLIGWQLAVAQFFGGRINA